jgi:membrane protein DedA with SNARE-associated domain
VLSDLDAWRAALHGMADPAVVALALALTPLLVEDLAIAAGAALATQGTVSWELAFVAVAGGIALGDVGLYALGAGARRVRWLERRFIGPPALALRARLSRQLPSAVLLARVIPGLRLLTYTASGFLRIHLPAFTAWVVVAVSAWTLALFALASALGRWLATTLSVPAPLAVAGPIVVLALLLPLWRRRRRAPSPARSSAS